MPRITDTLEPTFATAREHMQSDLENHGVWACRCQECRVLRDLTGMQKVLAVRPLVREIYDLEQQMGGLDGAEKEDVRQRYLALHDQLAEVIAG